MQCFLFFIFPIWHIFFLLLAIIYLITSFKSDISYQKI